MISDYFLLNDLYEPYQESEKLQKKLFYPRYFD